MRCQLMSFYSILVSVRCHALLVKRTKTHIKGDCSDGSLYASRMLVYVINRYLSAPKCVNCILEFVYYIKPARSVDQYDWRVCFLVSTHRQCHIGSNVAFAALWSFCHRLECSHDSCKNNKYDFMQCADPVTTAIYAVLVHAWWHNN